MIMSDTCPFIQCAYRLFIIGSFKASAQCLCKKVMIAIPLVLMVKRNNKEIVFLQCIQYLLTVPCVSYGVATGGIQAFENGGLEQEILDHR